MFSLFHKKKKVFIWTPIVLFVLCIVGLVCWSLYNTPRKNDDMQFGVTFSLIYARDYLELDWKQLYEEMLTDLQVKKIRLPIYWSEVEQSPGVFTFDDYDYMLQRANDVGAEVIAVVGRRQPRWPECHIPEWAFGTSESVQQANALAAVEATVEHFKDAPAITVWQVENEPLLKVFGDCPPPDLGFLEQAVDVVKRVDPSRPVMITESGELSTWLRTVPYADWIGVSMYRITWNQNFGYWYYPLSPRFYKNKVKLVDPLVDKVIISELQAEPWFRTFIYTVPLEEQEKSMNLDIFKQNIDFARRTGFDEAYLWGVEWWYWLKTKHNQPNIWNESKTLF